jgi:GNAT superfamily N-acetyltransferase
MADDADFEAVEAIENSADTILVEHLGASTWWPAPSAAARSADPGFMLLADGDTTGKPLGFAHVLEVDTIAHLEQLSVLPEFGRRGYGRRLVRAAAHEAHLRGHKQLTLRTFADVPWNAPFYKKCGFAETEPETPFHLDLLVAEEKLGLSTLGKRVQMTLRLR